MDLEYYGDEFGGVGYHPGESSLPLAVVSSGDWLRPAATRPRRSHSLVFVGSRWSLAAQRSGDGSGERKAEFISPGGMPSRPGGSGRRHRIPKLIKGLVVGHLLRPCQP